MVAFAASLAVKPTDTPDERVPAPDTRIDGAVMLTAPPKVTVPELFRLPELIASVELPVPVTVTPLTTTWPAVKVVGPVMETPLPENVKFEVPALRVTLIGAVIVPGPATCRPLPDWLATVKLETADKVPGTVKELTVRVPEPAKLSVPLMVAELLNERLLTLEVAVTPDGSVRLPNPAAGIFAALITKLLPPPDVASPVPAPVPARVRDWLPVNPT